jgi:hypothetical protein
VYAFRGQSAAFQARRKACIGRSIFLSTSVVSAK